MYVDALVTIDRNKGWTSILSRSECVTLVSRHLSASSCRNTQSWNISPSILLRRSLLYNKGCHQKTTAGFCHCFLGFNHHRWQGHLAAGKNKTIEDVNFLTSVLAETSFLTILLIRTKSSGFLAQGGRSTSFTTTSSSLTPSWYPLLLTNISGR